MKRTTDPPVKRKTAETNISLSLTIDGSGEYTVNTPVPFMNHMLELFARHGLFDLTVIAFPAQRLHPGWSSSGNLLPC